MSSVRETERRRDREKERRRDRERLHCIPPTNDLVRYHHQHHHHHHLMSAHLLPWMDGVGIWYDASLLRVEGGEPGTMSILARRAVVSGALLARIPKSSCLTKNTTKIAGILAAEGFSGGLGLVIALFGPQTSPRILLMLLAVSALTVDAGLWFLHPELQWYVGLSGALHGLLAGLLLLQWTIRNRRYHWLILLLSVKLAWEFAVGPLPLTGEIAGGPVVSQAHLFGALGGTLAALVFSIVSRRSLMR